MERSGGAGRRSRSRSRLRSELKDLIIVPRQTLNQETPARIRRRPPLRVREEREGRIFSGHRCVAGKASFLAKHHTPHSLQITRQWHARSTHTLPPRGHCYHSRDFSRQKEMARRNEEIYFSSLHPFSLYHNTTMPTISAKLKLKSLSVATPYTTHSEHEHGKHLCSSHLIFTFP